MENNNKKDQSKEIKREILTSLVVKKPLNGGGVSLSLKNNTN